MENFQGYMDKAVELVIVYAPKFVLAIIVLILGLWVIRIFLKGMEKAMVKANTDESLRKFFHSLVSALLKIVLLVSVASMVGIATTSFVAILGAAGLAVGLALQGSLANFAGGVLILFFKPFKVGDVIDAQGHLGKVHSIQIFNTVLKTFDNKTVIIPNGAISGGSLTNFSTEPTRRVDMTFGIGYGDDILKAKKILHRLVEEDSRILKDPASTIAVSELGDSSVNFVVRVWCNAADYWNIFFEMQEKVKLTFDQVGISIPFPQRDVHLYQNN
jgi:small conductance mechanosensitive channel